MKNVLTKVLLMLLTLTMVIGIASCKNDKKNDTQTTESKETEAAASDDGYQKDSIPSDLKFNNQIVTVLYCGGGATSDDRTSEFNPEVAGDFVEEAILARNTMVEDRLEVELNFQPTDGGYSSSGNSDFKKTLENDILGSKEFDICADYGATIGSCIISGMCTDLKSYDIIDFSAPWWASDLSEGGTVNEKLYFATGDISTSYLSSMYCMFFNEDLVTNLGLESPYDMVEMDNWKWEFFIEYCREIYSDLDQIEGKSVGDLFGITMTSIVAESVFYSGACKILDTDTDGYLILSDSFTNSRASNFYDLTQTFFNDSNDAYVSGDNWRTNFTEKRSVFAISQMNFAATLATQEDKMNFGVLPIPKYDDNQEYCSAGWVGRTLYFISAGSKVKDVAATCMECLASEGYRQVTPVLYEEQYKLRYSSGETHSQMIDLIRDSVVFDLAQIYLYSFGDTNLQIPTRLARALSMGKISGYATEMQNISTAKSSYENIMKAAVTEIAKSYE